MKVLRLTSRNHEEILKAAIQALRDGKVIVCPTDTVYGLLADATNRSAVARVFKLKKREKGKPLPVFVKDLQMARHYANISATQEKFLKGVWPGKVTAVLEAKHTLPKDLEAAGKIGLRMPNHAFVLRLLEKLNLPLTGTSANISGKPSCSSAREVQEQFKRKKYKPDFLIDAGMLPFSKPSMVIDITKNRKRVLRAA